MYPDLTQYLGPIPPKFQLNPLQKQVHFQVLGYQVHTVTTVHPVPSTGFIVTSEAGGIFAYTGDTSDGILAFLRQDLAEITGHLTPSTLRGHLQKALDKGIPVPKLLVVHMKPEPHGELLDELAEVAQSLDVDLTPGYEEMRVAV